MKTFENAEVNDRVWSFADGWGTIIDISNGLYPLWVKFDNLTECTYTFEGKIIINDCNPSLFWDEIKFNIPEKPKKLIVKSITKYCNIYPSLLKYIPHTMKVFETREEAIKDGSGTIFSGAEVTIKYQVEE